jgi:hypothetical protein
MVLIAWFFDVIEIAWCIPEDAISKKLVAFDVQDILGIYSNAIRHACPYR